MSSVTDEKDRARMVNAALKKSRGAYGAWTKVAREADDFAAGHQWNDEDRAFLENQDRPVITFNRVTRMLMLIGGIEIQQRQEALVEPYNPSLPGVKEAADITTSMVRWALDQCDGDDERTSVFLDMISRGMGWGEFFMDYDTDPNGLMSFRRFDGFEARWDGASREPNLRDSRWRARRRWMSYDDLVRYWGEKKAEEARAYKSEGGHDEEPEVVENVSPIPYEPGSETSGPGEHAGPYLVTQFQWWEWDTYYRTIDPQDPTGNKIITIPRDRFSLIEKAAEAEGKPPPPKVEQSLKRFRQTWVVGDLELETHDLDVNEFTLLPMTGLWDNKKRTFFGLVRLMKDPQEWANKFFSQTLEIFNRSRKNALIVAPDAVQDPEKFEEQINSPGAIAVGDPNKIKDLGSPQLPSALPYLLDYAVKSIGDAPGINLELLGQGAAQSPGITTRYRQNQGLTILGLFFNAERRHRMTETRLFIEYGRKYVADGRLIRLSGMGSVQAIPLFRQQLSRDYSIVLEQSASNPNMKMEVWTEFMPFLQIALKMGMFGVIAQILDYAPFPASIIEEIKKEMMALEQERQANPDQARGGRRGRGAANPTLDAMKAQKLQAATQLDIARARALDAATRLKGFAVGFDAMERSRRMREGSEDHQQRIRHREQSHILDLHGAGLDQLGHAIDGIKEEATPHI